MEMVDGTVDLRRPTNLHNATIDLRRGIMPRRLLHVKTYGRRAAHCYLDGPLLSGHKKSRSGCIGSNTRERATPMTSAPQNPTRRSPMVAHTHWQPSSPLGSVPHTL